MQQLFFPFKVVVRYFESSADLCLLEPWLRELGFTCCYGTIVLKIYRCRQKDIHFSPESFLFVNKFLFVFVFAEA